MISFFEKVAEKRRKLLIKKKRIITSD